MDFLGDILNNFWLPAVILVIFFFFIRRVNIKGKEAQQTVLGVVLGVLLGFSADITKKCFDDFSAQRKLKRAAIRLLKEDAKSVYRDMKTWKEIQNNSKTPSEFRRGVPAKLDLTYWKKLKESNEFLLLAADEPYTSIFKAFYGLEEINDLIEAARADNKNFVAAELARVFYEAVAVDNGHKVLLLYFMSEQEIKEYDDKRKVGKLGLSFIQQNNIEMNNQINSFVQSV